MNKGNAKVNKVGCQELRDELLAMLQVCFEGEARLQGEELTLKLPTGEAFSLVVAKIA